MSNILCVDDDQDACLMMSYLLQKEGRLITSALTATQAKALIEKTHYDLFILDEQLEDEDGFVLCRTIRDTDKEVPVIIYSGHNDDTDHQRAIEVGASVFLVKPEGIDVIADIVNSFLFNKESRSATHN